MINLLSIFGGKLGRATARKSSSQRGAGRLKAIVWTVLLVAGAYTCFKVIPIYTNEYQLQEKMQEVARFATVSHKTDDELRDAVWQEIQDLGIPARKEDIKIENTGRYAKISVDYSVPLDLIFYHGELHFSPSSDNKSLT
jgi:hypothetical protein